MKSFKKVTTVDTIVLSQNEIQDIVRQHIRRLSGEDWERATYEFRYMDEDKIESPVELVFSVTTVEGK